MGALGLEVLAGLADHDGFDGVIYARACRHRRRRSSLGHDRSRRRPGVENCRVRRWSGRRDRRLREARRLRELQPARRRYWVGHPLARLHGRIRRRSRVPRTQLLTKLDNTRSASRTKCRALASRSSSCARAPTNPGNSSGGVKSECTAVTRTCSSSTTRAREARARPSHRRRPHTRCFPLPAPRSTLA